MNIQLPRALFIFGASLLPLCLSGCLSFTPATYSGVQFPPTQSASVSFQENTVPGNCQGFAHLVATTSGPVNGREIQEALVNEAKTKGANHLLIGMAREDHKGKNGGFSFQYFGPQYPYPFAKGWLGWKFGIEEWEKTGPLIGFGLNNWGNPNSLFDSSLHIQAVFLRCE